MSTKKEVIIMDIGKKIRDLRVNANMTQQNLADKLHKTTLTVRKYELNQISPPINVLCEIAEIFSKPIVYFFDETHISNENNIESSVLKDMLSSSKHIDYLVDKYVSNKSTPEDTTLDYIKKFEEKYVSDELNLALSKLKIFLPVFKEINIEIKILNVDDTSKVELLNQKNGQKYILTLTEFNLLCKKLTLNIENEIKFLKYLK